MILPSLVLAFSLLDQPQPVLMSERSIGPATPIAGGKVTPIQVGDLTATLFVPDRWKPSKRNTLYAHFHSADWYVVSEYQRAGIKHPVLVCNFGQGSTVYAKPFAQVGSFQPWLDKVAESMQIKPTSIAHLRFTSFSAGYGAVRNLVADPDVLKKLDMVILSDSLYASLDPADPPSRKVLKEHLDCWMPLVEKAKRKKASVVMTTSQIQPESYAGTFEVAQQLVELAGGKMQSHFEGDIAALDPADQRILRTYSEGRWSVWSYAGKTPLAHMTQARHMADVMIELKRSKQLED